MESLCAVGYSSKRRHTGGGEVGGACSLSSGACETKTTVAWRAFRCMRAPSPCRSAVITAEDVVQRGDYFF